MRPYLLLFLLTVTSISFAQRELIHAKDPAALRSETVTITHFNLPVSYDRYAGIRFIDSRSLKAFAGFVQQNSRAGFRKITTARPFEEELNAAIKIKTDSAALADSVIVVLRNFWLYRTGVKEAMNCHVKALFFTKRADSFFYKGKIDTVFNRNAIMKYEWQDLPALFIEDMLASFTLHNHHNEKYYLQEEFSRLLFQQKQPLTDSSGSNALYLSFGDFLKGKKHATDFSLAAFYDQYRISFDNAGEGELLSAKVWGCQYNGAFYIRQGKLYSKAFLVENTLLLMDAVKTSPSAGFYSCPLVLNMESGKLE